MLRRAATSLAGLCLVALAGGSLTVPATAADGAAAGSPATASRTAEAPAKRARRTVATRGVEFTLTNVNETFVACAADGEEYQVRGRLVGPRRAVLGKAGVIRVNVLVHDAGTGAWFWNLKSAPGVDYATKLARKGETSLVLDRLGYDRSPLADGDATCLGAQAQMLHQVVQHLYSGIYRYSTASGRPPHAGAVVVHGHGTGATVAMLEAAEFDDTAGLVLMSSPNPAPKRLAVDEASAQTMRCLAGGDYTAYGETRARFRKLLFASASEEVRRLATRQRNATPCGDVLSLLSAVTSATADARRVEVPVLLLTGNRDARVRPMTSDEADSLFSASEDVTARTVRGSGSALPLEARAWRVRGTVLRWLARH